MTKVPSWPRRHYELTPEVLSARPIRAASAGARLHAASRVRRSKAAQEPGWIERQLDLVCYAPRRASSPRQRLLMFGNVEGSNELAWVRLEIDILASARRTGSLDDGERARLDDLQRRERELLGLDGPPLVAALRPPPAAAHQRHRPA